MRPSPKGLSGSGTDTLRWGQPVSDDQKSGYSFEGASVEVPLDGTEFTLGTFRHENYPVRGIEEYSTVSMRLRIEFQDGEVAQDFDFDFAHHETLNDPGDVDDVVHLPRLHACETVEIGGDRYTVIIIGFKQDGRTVTQFVSPENDANEAELVAKIVPAGNITVQKFTVCDPEGMCLGQGVFSYEYDYEVSAEIDIAHVCGSAQGPPLLHFQYKDSIVGVLTIRHLQSLYFTYASGGTARFGFSAFTPDGFIGISTGFATNQTSGLVYIHRSPDRDHSGQGKILVFPERLPTPQLCIGGPREDPEEGPRISPEDCQAQVAKARQACEAEKDALRRQNNQLIEQIKQLQPSGSGGGQQGQQGQLGGGQVPIQQGPLVETEHSPEIKVTPYPAPEPQPQPGLGDFSTTGGMIYHPEWNEAVWVWPNKSVHTLNEAALPGADQQQSRYWLFEETGASGEYRIRTSFGGQQLYATAPPQPGQNRLNPPAVWAQPQRDDDSQIWRVEVLSSSNDELSVAIRPKLHPGDYLAAPWVYGGWLWLRPESPSSPQTLQWNMNSSAHRWRLRQARI